MIALNNYALTACCPVAEDPKEGMEWKLAFGSDDGRVR
jgi:hypothetical protein